MLNLSLDPEVAALKPSKTMVVADRATAMRDSGIDVIKLAVGELDFRTPYPVVQVIIFLLILFLKGKRQSRKPLFLVVQVMPPIRQIRQI